MHCFSALVLLSVLWVLTVPSQRSSIAHFAGHGSSAQAEAQRAHLLRHSVASSMLRQGASLQEISALLRHRSIETTQIYAKVDVAGLQQIAQPWPEVQP